MIKNKLKFRVLVCALLLILGTFTNPVIVSASEMKSEKDLIKEIARAMNKTYSSTLEDVNRIQSDNLNLTRKDIIDSLHKDIVNDNVISNVTPTTMSSRSTKTLPDSFYGDVFYFPAYSLGKNHGHAGMYAKPDVVIHAPGRGKVVTKAHVSTVIYSPGGSIARYNKWQHFGGAEVNGLANLHLFPNGTINNAEYYLKRPYNTSIDNMKCGTRQPVNCSQLVYCAYKSKSIDLSNGSLFFVSPIDLIRDNDMRIIKTLN